MVGSYQIPLAESANAGYTLRTGEPTIVADMAAEMRFDRRRSCCRSASSAA